MGYGEQLREGAWYPGPGYSVDPTVSAASNYGKAHGSRVMPYIYPNLAFASN